MQVPCLCVCVWVYVHMSLHACVRNSIEGMKREDEQALRERRLIIEPEGVSVRVRELERL